MKKVISVLCSCAFALLFASCAWSDKILGNKMIEYYSDDNNYEQLEGTIISISQIPHTQDNLYDIEINTAEHDFPNYYDGYLPFMIYSDLDSDLELQVGDDIIFISAPMYFYNGHELPIVSLEMNGKSYLSFEKGKADYLNWIETTFLD